MREFVVTLAYDRGVDPVMDVFLDHPELVASAVDISVGTGGLTRVDRLSGPPAAVATLREVFLDPVVCNECAAPHGDCDAERSYEVLDTEDGGLTVYSYHEEVSFCNSVPYHASHQLPPGVLFDSQRRGGRHEWRLLLRGDEGVGDLYDALTADLPAGVTVSFQRLGQLERWGEQTGTVADLSPEQRRTIETAVAMGYYGTPREATLSDLAAALSTPQSTVRYRLRRAEAWLTDTAIPGPPGESASETLVEGD
jgi:predicted DNA binding protein